MLDEDEVVSDESEPIEEDEEVDNEEPDNSGASDGLEEDGNNR